MTQNESDKYEACVAIGLQMFHNRLTERKLGNVADEIMKECIKERRKCCIEEGFIPPRMDELCRLLADVIEEAFELGSKNYDQYHKRWSEIVGFNTDPRQEGNKDEEPSEDGESGYTIAGKASDGRLVVIAEISHKKIE